MSNINYIKKIIIGTANFGNSYGIDKKKITNNQLIRIFEYIKKKKFNYIDTAKSYGNSEKILGNSNSPHLKIISKLPKLNKNIQNIEQWIFKNVTDSILKTKTKKLYAILIHHSDDLISNNGRRIYKCLMELKKKKLVKKIGISAYSTNKVDIILKRYKLDIIQMPLSVFDRRILKNNWINKIKKKNIEIHARSVFLQGLLLKNSTDTYFNKWKKNFKIWSLFCKKSKVSKDLAALQFVINNKKIDKVIIGFNNINELKKNVKNTLSNKKIIFSENLMVNDERLLNPYNWKVGKSPRG